MAFEGSLVSVVIPVRNGERFINETLASALAQTYEPLEVVVVTTDQPIGLRSLLRLRPSAITASAYFERKGSALRLALEILGSVKRVAGLIAPLDADDLWHPEKIAR